MVRPIIYHMPESPPSRGALHVARMLNVDVEVRNIDLFAGEQLKPEFIKVNPMHTVPTLDDNGFVVVDSHAIATYLASKFGKDDKLYPSDLKKRSLVDQRLNFNNGFLYKRVRDIGGPVFFNGVDIIPEDLKANAHEVLGWLEGFLKPTGWVAGDNITIADAMCVSSVTTFIAEGCDMNKYPLIQAWIARCRKTIPDFDAVDKAANDSFHKLFKSKLKPGQI